MQVTEATTCIPGERVTLGCFEVAGRTVAIDVAQLREVVRFRPATPLPQAPPLVEGVIDLRDTVIPVIDLGRALMGQPVTPAGKARIVIAEIEGLIVGLAVDAALEVLNVDLARVEDPPALATQAGYAAARALVRREDAEPIVVLALEHLLENVYRSAVESREVAR